MSFVEDYVNGYRDSLVESGDWDMLSKREQTKVLKMAVQAGEVAYSRLKGCHASKNMLSALASPEAIRKALIAKALKEYAAETDLLISRQIAQAKSLLGVDS